MRREHDDESGDAPRHDGTGQRHGRRGNAGRIASPIAIGLLRANSLPDALAQKRRLDFNTLFNGAAGFSRYVF
jgi:hypothetical protein